MPLPSFKERLIDRLLNLVIQDANSLKTLIKELETKKDNAKVRDLQKRIKP